MNNDNNGEDIQPLTGGEAHTRDMELTERYSRPPPTNPMAEAAAPSAPPMVVATAVPDEDQKRYNT